MDDMLIVRMSERSKERFSKGRRPNAIGVNLGIILGIGLGMPFARILDSAPHLGMAIGMATGIAIGAIVGKTLPAPRAFKKRYAHRHYDGMPFSDNAANEKTEKPEPSR